MRLRCPWWRRSGPIALCAVLFTLLVAFRQAAPTNVVVDAALVAACSQTLNDGQDVDAAYAAVADGVTWVICLNTGTYDGAEIEFANETRTSGYVTIREAPGQTVILDEPDLNNVDFIKFLGLTLSNVVVKGCSTNIQLLDGDFVENPGGPGQLRWGVFFNESGNSCGVQNNVVDNMTFDNLDYAFADERSATEGGVNTLTIKNSRFRNIGANAANGTSGGLHLGGGTNITIGPNNIFLDMTQAICTADSGQHCDDIQPFDRGVANLTITGNWFGRTSIASPSDSTAGVCLGFYDGATNVLIQNNVFFNCARNLQAGDVDGMLILHNTFKNGSVEIGSDPGDTNEGTWAIRDNIIDGMDFESSQGTYCGATCTQTYNLLSRGGRLSGLVSPHTIGAGCTTGCVTGDANYNGAIPVPTTTWPGFLLAPSSPGENVASDSFDMGTLTYGS